MEMAELNYGKMLIDMGIKKGDILDVASGLASVILYCRNQNIKFSSDHLLDAMKEVVGAEGTVMVRAFTWDFCHGIPFDLLNSPSRVGVLGDVAMKRSDFRRSRHPIYSWMVWGKYQKYLCEMENVCSFGGTTPFDFLYKNNAKQICIGNIPWVFTQRHHIEQMARVPYRYEKMFKGEYIDGNGTSNMKTYSMYVRQLDLQIEYMDYPEMKDEWEKTGIRIFDKWNNINYSVIKIKEVSNYVYEDLTTNYGRNTLTINGIYGYREIL